MAECVRTISIAVVYDDDMTEEEMEQDIWDVAKKERKAA